MVNVKEPSCFIVNKQDYTGKQLKKLYVDSWDISVPTKNLSLSDQFILPVKAQKLRELAEEQLQKGKLSPELEKIYRNTQEEDNPILIIGDYKP